MDNAQNIINKIDNFLSQNDLEITRKDLVFKRCFNEAWFSNTLAWLLDPKGSHKLVHRLISSAVDIGNLGYSCTGISHSVNL